MEKQAVIHERSSFSSKICRSYESYKPYCFHGWSIGGHSSLARRNDTDERVSRTIGRGLMGIVVCRLFGGERGESKWGITSTRLRASVFPPQYPGARWIPIIPWVRNSRFARFVLIERVCTLTVLHAHSRAWCAQRVINLILLRDRGQRREGFCIAQDACTIVTRRNERQIHVSFGSDKLPGSPWSHVFLA